MPPKFWEAAAQDAEHAEIAEMLSTKIPEML